MRNFYINSRYLTLGIIILLLTDACHNENEETIKTINIEDNLKNFHSLKLSDISYDIEYIVLETKGLCLIDNIKYLDLARKYTLIHDWKRCLLFSRSGKFLTQIGKEGRGPGEYSHPGQIRIIDDEILIPDAGKNVIHIYDIRGKFIENVQSPGKFSNQFQVNNYLPISDSLFLVQIPNQSGRENTRISLINRKGKVMTNFENTTFFNNEVTTRFSSTDISAQFYHYDSTIRYKEELNDTVWQIEQNKLIPIYVFDRGSYGTPNYIRGLPLQSFFQKLSNTVSIDNIYETNEHIILKTNFRKHYPFDFYRQDLLRKSPHYILGVYNKLGKRFFFIRPTNIKDQVYPTGFENDIDGGVNFMPEYKFGDTLLVSWINSFELKNYLASETFKNFTPKYPEKKKELEKLANSLNENDNPVLMLVKLKK